MVSFVHIPFDKSKPLQDIEFDKFFLAKKRIIGAGDLLPQFLTSKLSKEDKNRVGLKSEDIKIYPLLRIHKAEKEECYQQSNEFGIFAYNFDVSSPEEGPNIRATCLAMSCGLHSNRFVGDVYVSKLGYLLLEQKQNVVNIDLSKKEIQYGCITPDIRINIIRDVMKSNMISGNENNVDNLPDESNSNIILSENIILPAWLTNASMLNYEDAGALATLARVMKTKGIQSSYDETQDNNEEGGDDSKSDRSDQSLENEIKPANEFIARKSLCLHCRGPCDILCSKCQGVYLCPKPKKCRRDGWSHQCLCYTWKIYTQRRNELSSFPFDKWHIPLMGRQFQLSDSPYKIYLTDKLGVLKDSISSWWTTELNGWSGGSSESAKKVNVLVRHSYQSGFQISEDQIPPERKVTSDDWIDFIGKNESGLLELNSWREYYAIRNIPMSSPVALLLTFPLTIYYALLKHGSVPITVARMLKRPLRLHVIGIEKELNMLDIFKEIGYLFPEDIKLELVFIVRKDMLPPKCQSIESTSRNGSDVKIELLENLTLILKSGTYCDDLDPSFDCGSGSPDMIVGMNAGLFAYESWRHVVEYLNSSKNRGVVGVFTDYNEHSATNCAGLGGRFCRESVHINPFRQPRAMPVYSMNLPQFSNSFVYVYNEQKLDF